MVRFPRDAGDGGPADLSNMFLSALCSAPEPEMTAGVPQVAS